MCKLHCHFLVNQRKYIVGLLEMLKKVRVEILSSEIKVVFKCLIMKFLVLPFKEFQRNIESSPVGQRSHVCD